ncbi:Insulin receptor substrate 1 [Gryllus bimaculatus]|nr:Insulin receptor substrate 1 [Gryllus bimaculatus]
MSSVKSSSSAGDSAWKELERQDGRAGEILKMGYLKKLKTMKKKFFVLRGESSQASARLEYYDSEKKWRSHHSPKRSIALKTCFNINRRTDTKHKNVIALYTKDDCFCLVLETEEELEEWLNSLLSLQHGEDVPDGEPPKPTFEHVWQVTVQKKGLGNSRHILGPYLLCLTDKTLSLVSKSQEEKANRDTYEFGLMCIRRCGHSDCFFYMEVGRSACTGAGDLWMQTEDPNIAQNMHAAILSAMSNNSSKEDVVPRPRTRSSSAIEASKPISMIPRKTSHLGPMKTSSYYSTSEEASRAGAHLNFVPNRAQPAATYTEHPSMSPSTPEALHSQDGKDALDACPASGACSTDSTGSSLSIDDPSANAWTEEGMVELGRYSTSLTPDEPAIMEVEEYAQWPGPGSDGNADGNYMPMDRSQPSLSLPIQSAAAVNTVTAPHRKISPNLSSSGFKSGSPSQGSYMEMYSPCGSSPMENTGYMAMSPGGGGSVPSDATPRMQIYSRAASSANHSRGSSLAEDDFHPSEMSPASSCSITSGTPSTDLRFSEYHLEKVSSYFTPSEEDETSSLDRPIPRAYSVGSRPENMKRPIRLESQGQVVDPVSRVRAFSVGSRAPLGGKSSALAGRPLVHDPVSGSRLLPSVMGATLTPPSHHILHSVMAPSVSVASSKKSSSAPLLSNSWSGSGTSSLRHGPHSSHSSVEPMDDLMEMDFTRASKSSGKNSSSKSAASRSKGDNTLPPHHSSPFSDKSAGTPSGYMDMSSRSVGSSKPHTPTCGPYLEMKPGLSEMVSASPPGSNVMSRSPKSSIHSGPYLEMKPGLPQESPLDNGDLRNQSIPITVPSKPVNTSISPKSHVGPYVEMKAGSAIQEVPRKTSISASPPTRYTVDTSAISMSSKPFTPEEVPYVPMKPVCITSESSLPFFTKPIPVPSAGPYLEMKPGSGGDQPQNLPPTTHRSSMTPTNVSPKSSSFNVGPYVDMTQPAFSASSQFARQAARKPASPIQEEYVDMSVKPVRKTSRQENAVAVVGSSVVNRTAPVDTPQPKKPPEGYMEMSWNRGNKSSSPKSSLEDYKSPPSSSQDDYMNMSFEGRGSLNKRKERRNSRKEKTRYSSQPIAIGGPPKDSGGKTSSASTSPVFSFMGRKCSTGTPPKIPGFLPLAGGGAAGSASTASPGSSPFSSLRRTRKVSTGSRRESGDASSGLTTPTGSTTIFPLSLNSPGSPMKPFPGTASASTTKPLLHSVPGSEAEPCHKCPVDATSGTVRISYSYPEMQLSTSSAASTPATPDSSSSSEQPTPVNAESIDDITKVDDSRNHDYVNYCPRKGLQSGTTSRDDDFGEYAVMRPVPVVRAGTNEPTRKISAPTFGGMNRRFNNVHQGIAGLTLSSPSLNSSKNVNAAREVTPPITRKGSFNSPLPAASPLYKTHSKSVGGTNVETANGPKVITSEVSSSLSRQPSNASSSSKASCSSRESKTSRQLSRSSSGSSEVGRCLEASRSVEDKSDAQSTSESLSVKSEDSGTISPASSQTAVASRPPSVSSERELHYASLDLAPSGSEGEEGARSPRTLMTQGSLTESSNSSPSPNPALGSTGGANSGEAFTYAEIDFSRRERSRSSTSSKKVKQ